MYFLKNNSVDSRKQIVFYDQKYIFQFKIFWPFQIMLRAAAIGEDPSKAITLCYLRWCCQNLEFLAHGVYSINVCQIDLN